MNSLAKSEVLSLSVSERIQLVEDIWDTIMECPDEVDLSNGKRMELDRRLETYQQSPDEGSSWGLVRERIRCRK